MWCLQANSMSLPLTYFGPLSTRIIAGFPRHTITWFRLRMTRAAGSEKSTSMANPSQLKSSRMFKIRNDFPLQNWSNIKSIDHSWLGRFGTDSDSGRSHFSCLRGLMRRFSSSSQWIPISGLNFSCVNFEILELAVLKRHTVGTHIQNFHAWNRLLEFQ